MHEYSLVRAGVSRWAAPAGLGNYIDAFGDVTFQKALLTTLIYTVASVGLETVLGLVMALTMATAFRGQGLLRTVVLVPWAVLTVVTAIMWRTMVDPNLGFVNQILGTKTVWLGEEPHALIVMIVADVWKTAPFMALLLLAGLQVIPGEIYEAAKVDGATVWQRFRKITLPLLMPALLVALIFRTLDALRVFDLPKVLNNGANGTTSLSLLAQRTFQENRLYGEGAAISIITFLLVMLISFAYIRLVGGNIRGMTEDR
jgi:multiple sugar transport system permease protein